SENINGNRTRLIRGKDRAHYEKDSVYSVLDAGFLCHVGYVVDSEPRVLPTAYVRVGDAIYLHGHLKNQMMNALLDGQTASLCVTHLDGLVLARSGFHHSVNYRSVTLFGKAEKVADEDKEALLDKLVNHLVPNRAPELRKHTPQELNATLVLRIPIDEAAAKIRTGPPIDAEKDYDTDIWAGVINVQTVMSDINNCPRLDQSIETPEHVEELVKKRVLFG
ncbi:MAG: pyridoxamine 5'-phosphate oxidase family protein, partial [Pseudomonadales bacterium]|nr:pyridoxamine 5'-phosphate oxidase family protein [Pseudomonadales bacterium]